MKKYIESMALFMICLIVFMPIYISDAYASINRVTALGVEGVPNFGSENYDITITAEAALDSGNITKNNVRLKNIFDAGTSLPFDSCVSSGNSSSGSTCSIHLLKDENTNLNICPQTNFEVLLYDYYPSAVPIDTKSVAVKCDSQGPIVSASISPQIIGSGDITLSYNIEDPNNGMTRCSGIEKIEYYFNNAASGAATTLLNRTPCTYSNSIAHTVSGYRDGPTTIIVKAYDRLGNSNSANASFIVDKTAPKAEANVTITDLYGNEIPYFKPQNVLVDVVLTITDAGGVDSYTINAASFTISAPSCVESGTDVICRWDNVQMLMNNATFSKTINVQARDVSGNNGSINVVLSGAITQDLNAPVISVGNLTVGTADGSSLVWFRPGNFKTSFSAEVTDDMSGIDSISGDFSQLQVVSGDVPSCTGAGTYHKCTWSNLVFYADTPSFNKPIRIIATDHAGNQKIETRNVAFNYRADSSAPALVNFSIARTDGRSLSAWIGNEDVPLRITADISEQGSGLDKAKADFSSLNPAYTSYSEGTCVQISASGVQPAQQTNTGRTGSYSAFVSNTSSQNISMPQYRNRCTWNAIAHFNTSGNPSSYTINFNLSDKSLNLVSAPASQSFMVDVDGPTVSSLITAYPFDNKYYVGANTNEFIISVSDSGIGMNMSNVFLDLSSIGFDANHKVTSCSAGTCLLTMPGCLSVNEGMYSISVNTNTADNLGNRLSEPFYANVTLDRTAPAVTFINITPVPADTPLYINYIQTGNGLMIAANITEATSILTATANLANFISNETDVLASACAQERDSLGNNLPYWTCLWQTDTIDIRTYKKDKIFLNITDVAGNSLIYPYEIEVFEAMNGTVNLWTNAVGASSPNAIDRQIITYYNPSMWFPVSLTPISGASSQIWPLEVVVDSCLSDNSSTPSRNYISSAAGQKPLLVNTNTIAPTRLPYNMYLDYELEQSAPDVDSINITCVLKIKTLVDSRKISPYEYENVTVSLKYYNNPLGSLDSNIQAEIDSIKNSFLVKQSWIGKISKLMQIGGALCGLVGNLIKLNTVLSAIADALGFTPWTKPLSLSMGQISSSLNDFTAGYWGYVNTFCKFLNCQLFYGEAWSTESTSTLASISRWGLKYGEDLWDVKNSLIMSIVFLCLPGVLYNLQKARAIDCQYAKCLKSTAVGMPLQFCVKQRDYGWCSYVWGQVFNLLPLNTLFQITKLIKQALQNPAQFILIILKYFCRAPCSATSGLCTACIVAASLETFIDVLCDLGIGSDSCEPFWEDLKVDDSACDDL